MLKPATVRGRVVTAAGGATGAGVLLATPETAPFINGYKEAYGEAPNAFAALGAWVLYALSWIRSTYPYLGWRPAAAIGFAVR